MILIKGELSKIKDLGPIEIECNSSGDFSKAARRLEELANLIEDIGLDKLQEQLGIDLSFLSWKYFFHLLDNILFLVELLSDLSLLWDKKKWAQLIKIFA